MRPSRLCCLTSILVGCVLDPASVSDEDGRGDETSPDFSCEGCTILFEGRSFKNVLPYTRDSTYPPPKEIDPIRQRASETVEIPNGGNIGAQLAFSYPQLGIGLVEIEVKPGGPYSEMLDLLCFLDQTKASCLQLDPKGARIRVSYGAKGWWPAGHFVVGRKADLLGGGSRATAHGSATITQTKYRTVAETSPRLFTGYDLKWLDDVAVEVPNLWIEEETLSNVYTAGRFFYSVVQHGDASLRPGMFALKYDLDDLSEFQHLEVSAWGYDEIVTCLANGASGGVRLGSCFASSERANDIYRTELLIPKSDARFWGADHLIVTTRKNWDARNGGDRETQGIGLGASVTYWTSCEGSLAYTARCQAPPLPRPQGD